MPGAATFEGGIATFSLSSDRSARCAEDWNAQFLFGNFMRRVGDQTLE